MSATIVHRCGSTIERPRHGRARGTAPLTSGPGGENYGAECGAAPLKSGCDSRKHTSELANEGMRVSGDDRRKR